MESKRQFAIGDKVRVAEDEGWPDSPVRVVSSVPDLVTTLQGEDYFYWVRFDTPAQDISGDGPYKSAQILSRALTLENNIRSEVADPGLEARTVEWFFSRLPPEAEGPE